MITAWGSIFEKFGTKIVTITDKSKSAYVPTAAQRKAIAAAGIKPSTSRPAAEFPITILNDVVKKVGASYYHSIRATDPGRHPEPRMGHAFISSWLDVGDTVVIGNIGGELFAVKNAAGISDELISSEIAKKASAPTILALAGKAKGKPSKRSYTRDDYVRNIYVVAAALIRSNGKCEQPGCTHSLFKRADGTLYLEVHHIIPLGENGDDTVANVAALCPHCHREQHFGAAKALKRRELAKYIARITKP